MAIDPDSEWAANNKGIALYELGRYEEAVSSYDFAIALTPSNSRPWNNKGAALHHLGRYGEAIECFDRAIALDPENAKYWNNKCGPLLVLKQFQAVVACSKKSIQLAAIFSHPWRNLGFALRLLDRLEEAITCYDKAIELDPLVATPWFDRAEAYMAMRHWNKGASCLRTSMQQSHPVPEHGVSSMIALLLPAFAAGNDATVREFAQLYAEFGALTQLGDGLVRSLAKIDVENATEASLSKWRDFWNEFGAPYPEMQIPLRLFSVGIEYLMKQDRKVLLDLVLAERQILEQALGIDALPSD